MNGFTVELPKIPDKEYNIRDFGAQNGGSISNTKEINAAISAAHAEGGGKVIIPAGIWLTGPIELKSNIELHLETGAVLLFGKSKEEYPLYMSNFEGTEHIRAKSPITAENASNIAITGTGTIDGNGQLWRPVKQVKMTRSQWDTLLQKSGHTVTANGSIWLPTKTSFDGWNLSLQNSPELTSLDTAQDYWDFFRPVMVRLYRCDHILIENVTLQNSPAWNLHPCFCQHITVKNASIRNPYYAQNGDGLDLESCQYAEITGTTFDVGDDAFCMKSGKGRKARETKAPTEYVRISDCTVYHGHGGFVVGSEMSRGVRNIEVKNCTFIGTDVGIRFKTALGRGGVVEDITLDGIQMLDIGKEAIIFTMGYVLDHRESAKTSGAVRADDIPYFKNITLRNITCSGAEYGLKAEGIDLGSLEIEGETDGQPVIDNIVIENAHINADIEQQITNCGKILFENRRKP